MTSIEHESLEGGGAVSPPRKNRKTATPLADTTALHERSLSESAGLTLGMLQRARGGGDVDSGPLSECPAPGSNAPSVPAASNASECLVENPGELDPFSPERLRLSQDFGAAAGVAKLLTTVPVRKPSREWFIQVHPDTAYRLNTYVVELKEDGETYLVAPSLWGELTGEATFGPRSLITAMNRQGVVFIWPIRLPGTDGKIDTWSQSALEAVDRATGRWIRMAANMSLGAYEIWESTAKLQAPVWPEAPFAELLAIAFKGRKIDSRDHAVLRKLRGEA